MVKFQLRFILFLYVLKLNEIQMDFKKYHMGKVRDFYFNRVRVSPTFSNLSGLFKKYYQCTVPKS